MSGVTWEWNLSGSLVRASVDANRQWASVWVGEHLVARVPATRAAEPVALALPGGEPFTVAIHAGVPACELRLGGNVVPPARTLVPTKKNPLLYVLVGALALAGLALAVRVSWVAVSTITKGATGPPVKPQDFELTKRFATSDGVLVAHFPDSFSAKQGKSEAGRYVSIEITRRSGTSSVALVALLKPGSKNARDLDRAVTEGEHAEWEKNHLDFAETGTTDGVCLGGPAVVGEGSLTKPLVKMSTWHCTFMRGSAGFRFFYVLPANADPDEAKVLAKIVEATEISR
jgi:hypothetical protein